MNRLERVKFDEKVAVAHSDSRRDIYDPTKILDGLGLPWYLIR